MSGARMAVKLQGQLDRERESNDVLTQRIIDITQRTIDLADALGVELDVPISDGVVGMLDKIEEEVK